jgi:polysaccharide export outer membrane protein
MRYQNLVSATLLSFFCVLSACSAQSDASNKDYKLREGDQFGISVWGYKEFDVSSLTVRPDGKVAVPVIGEMYVVGETPDSLASKLEIGFSRILKQPKVTVTLQSAVGEKFYISGPVNRQGTYNYITGIRVMEAIVAAGDLEQTANDKKATILRDGVSIPVDLEAALKGDPDKNLPLKAGDTLVIDKGLITFVGSVAGTGPQPLRRGTTLMQALAAVGGTREGADVEKVQILRGPETIIANLRDITADPDKDIPLRPDDIIKVDSADVRSIPVFITGQVVRPGPHRFLPGYRDTLADAINWAGGLAPEADMGRVKIRRTDPSGETKETIVDMRTEAGRDYQLKENDYIEVTKKRRNPAKDYISSGLSALAVLVSLFRR